MVPSRRPSRAAMAFGAVLVAALVAAAFLLTRLARLPSELAGAIPHAVRETAAAASEGLARLAAAIRTRRVTVEFAGTASELRGVRRLQVAELSQVEVVERRDAARLLGLSLPDVVVSARAPVTFTYVVDLEGAWEFDLAERTVTVVAPGIGWNVPAVDVSRLTFVKTETSILRDEDAVVEELRRSLTGILRERARQNVPLVRETARRQTEEFVRSWLLRAYGVGDDVRVVVRFRDEPATPASPGPAVGPIG